MTETQTAGATDSESNHVCDRCGKTGLDRGDMTELANGEMICPACEYQNVQDGD